MENLNLECDFDNYSDGDYSVNKFREYLEKKCNECKDETEKSKLETFAMNFIENLTENENLQDLTPQAIRKTKNQIRNDFFPKSYIADFEKYRKFYKTYEQLKNFYSKLLSREFPVGSLNYIGARTSRGKTTMLISLAVEAIAKGKEVLFITLEENYRQIINRLILNYTYKNRKELDNDVNGNAVVLSFNKKTPSEYIELMKANSEKTTPDENIPKPQKALEYYLKSIIKDDDNFLTEIGIDTNSKDYKPNIYTPIFQSAIKTVRELIISKRLVILEGYLADTKTICQEMTYTDDNTIIFLDYIQLMHTPQTTTTRQLEIQNISNEIAKTAGKNNLIVIAGAQFTRPPQITKGTLETENGNVSFDVFDETSFREAGDIEQDGAVLFGIGREKRENTDEDIFYYKNLKDRFGSADTENYYIMEKALAFSYFAPNTKDGKREKWQAPKRQAKRQTHQRKDKGEPMSVYIKQDPTVLKNKANRDPQWNKNIILDEGIL